MNCRRATALAALIALFLAVPGTGSAATSKSGSKKAQTRPATEEPKKKSAQTQTAPAHNVPQQTQGGVTVMENYYLDLPGFDLSTLTPTQKDKFLERVNKEPCTCGCKNDTIARCLVNDPKCPVVRGLAEKIFSEVKAGQ